MTQPDRAARLWLGVSRVMLRNKSTSRCASGCACRDTAVEEVPPVHS